MSRKFSHFSRRDFIKTAGAVGIGSLLSPIESLTHAQVSSDPKRSPLNVVPTRPFGKTGVFFTGLWIATMHLFDML